MQDLHDRLKASESYVPPDYSRAERINIAIKAVDRIADYLTGMNEPSFRASLLHQDGVAWRLGHIANVLRPLAANDPAFERKLPGYGRIRDVVHACFDVDREEDVDPSVVWSVASTVVPPLRPRLQTLLDGSNA